MDFSRISLKLFSNMKGIRIFQESKKRFFLRIHWPASKDLPWTFFYKYVFKVQKRICFENISSWIKGVCLKNIFSKFNEKFFKNIFQGSKELPRGFLRIYF